jgi:hypothetical protein
MSMRRVCCMVSTPHMGIEPYRSDQPSARQLPVGEHLISTGVPVDFSPGKAYSYGKFFTFNPFNLNKTSKAISWRRIRCHKQWKKSV